MLCVVIKPEKITVTSTCTQTSDIDDIWDALYSRLREHTLAETTPHGKWTHALTTLSPSVLIVMIPVSPTFPMIVDCATLTTSPCIHFSSSDSCPLPSFFGRVMSITYEPKVLPPTIYHVQITAHGRDSLTLFVNVSDFGVVFCTAIPAAQSLYSSDQVFFLGTRQSETAHLIAQRMRQSTLWSGLTWSCWGFRA